MLDMSRVFIVIAALITVAVIVIADVYISKILLRRENRKLFESVQIGDLYIQNLHQPNPFQSQWGNVITIIDKKLGEDGILYVKYQEGLYGVQAASFTYLIDELDYEPYNNQDK